VNIPVQDDDRDEELELNVVRGQVVRNLNDDPEPNIDENVVENGNLQNVLVEPNHGEENIHQAGEVPPVFNDIHVTFPHIFYKKGMENRVLQWAGGMVDKLNLLIQAHEEGRDQEIEDIIIEIYRFSHPKSKGVILQPNITVDDDDEVDLDGVHLAGLDDLPIIENNKASALWKSLRNGDISKARRSLQSGGIGDIAKKSMREMICSKFPRDVNRLVAEPIQRSSNIDFNDEETKTAIKNYIFSFKRGQAISALNWSMDFFTRFIIF